MCVSAYVLNSLTLRSSFHNINNDESLLVPFACTSFHFVSAQYSGYMTTICKIRFCQAHAKITGGDENVGQSEACPTKETPKTMFLKVFILAGFFTYGPVYMDKEAMFSRPFETFLLPLDLLRRKIWPIGRWSNCQTWQLGGVDVSLVATNTAWDFPRSS